MKAMKKIISAVSAVVMAASTFAAMTTVNAAEKDLYLKGTVNDNKVVIDVYAGSDVSVVENFTLMIKSSATTESVQIINGGYLTAADGTPNYATADMCIFTYAPAVGTTITDASKPIIKYEYTYAAPVTEDIEFSVISGSTKKHSTFKYTSKGGEVLTLSSKSTTAAELSLLGTSVTVKAPAPAPAEETVTAEKLAEGVANDYEIDGKIYKYTPFKAAVDFASKTIKGAKIEINGVETAVDTTKFSNIPAEITGSATVGIIVKSLDSQTVGAVKLIIE